jgi:5-methyltetrahydropteroyltriglutamate--homocysteine methyltransferase
LADEGGPVTLQQNTDRIQTTHIGSLPRPHRLLDLLKAKLAHQPFDRQQFDDELAKSVGCRAQAG